MLDVEVVVDAIAVIHVVVDAIHVDAADVDHMAVMDMVYQL